MLPLLLLGGAAALAAALYLYLRRNKKGNDGKPHPPPFSGSTDEGPTDEKSPYRWRERNEAAIDDIVRHIHFASGKVKLKHVKVGEKNIASPIPTDEITVRPIRSAGEIPRVLISSLAGDDDSFYSGFAGQSLPVLEYQERVDLMDDIEGVPRKVLLLVIDVSGSMKEYGRIDWTLELCRRAIRRAMSERSEVALLPFSSIPHAWHVAKTVEECEALIRALPDILQPDGGTSISTALKEALLYLSDDSFTDRKILLDTDGQDNIPDPQRLKEEFSNLDTELHTVCLGVANSDLRRISTRYDLFADP